ncbi:hypothetical protein D3C71_1096670 [compost metagenome]
MGDPDLRHFPNAEIAALDKHLSVNLRCVVLRTAHIHIAASVVTFHQNVQNLSHKPAATILRYFPLQLHQSIGPPFLHVLRHLVRQSGGRRSFFHGICKYAEPVKSDFTHKVAKTLEILFGLPGKTDDQRGAQRDFRNKFPNARNEFACIALPARPAHPLQDGVFAVLQRHVHILADFRVGCHRLDQFFGKKAGICIMKPDPFDSFYLTYPVQKLGKLELAVQVSTVIGGILSDKADFLHALRSQCLHLRDNGLHAAAAECPPHDRNAAEGTVVVASLRNLHISREPRCRHLAGKRLFIIEYRIADPYRTPASDSFIHNLHDVMEVAGAHNPVDFRHFLHQLGLVALRQAARNDQRF